MTSSRESLEHGSQMYIGLCSEYCKLLPGVIGMYHPWCRIILNNICCKGVQWVACFLPP